jgi:ribonucleoside-diphosphate reductase beta chain
MPDLLLPRDYYKPFSYPWAFDAYRTMAKMRWEADLVPLDEDIADWKYKLIDPERNLLTQLFRFFTQGDVDIGRAYRDRYMPKFQHPEIEMLLVEIGSSEANHVYAYSKLLDTIGMPEVEYMAFHHYAEMMAKHEYLFRERFQLQSWLAAATSPLSVEMRSRAALALDIAVFSAFGEGVQLFSSFAMLMRFQANGVMKGMSTIIEWSIRDESHHVECMTKLFRQFIVENPSLWRDELKASIYQACVDMVALEDRFIDLAFSVGGVRGMTPEDTKRYIRFIADRRLNALGLKDKFGIEENPFEWLEWIIGAPTHTNFFEQRPTEYSQGGATDWADAFESRPAGG